MNFKIIKSHFFYRERLNINRKINFLLLLIISLSIGCSPSTKNNTTKKTGKIPKIKSLFNGKNLDGWIIHGTEKWYVENGELISESGSDKQYGYLATVDSYKNFELTVEFKQAANGNSGVFIRSSIEGTKITGWQAEVAPTGNHTGGIYESYGRGWLIKPKAGSGDVKMGEWNTMKIIVVDDVVTTYLNGEMMITLKDAKIGAANGQIALQIHDGGGIKVHWRNIQLRAL